MAAVGKPAGAPPRGEPFAGGRVQHSIRNHSKGQQGRGNLAERKAFAALSFPSTGSTSSVVTDEAAAGARTLQLPLSQLPAEPARSCRSCDTIACSCSWPAVGCCGCRFAAAPPNRPSCPRRQLMPLPQSPTLPWPVAN